MGIQTTTRGRRAFTLTELLVVIAVIVLLAAALLPTLAVAKRKSSKIGCVNCLKQIYLASKIWSGNNGDKYPVGVSMTNGGAMEFAEKGIAFPIFQVMSNELSTPKILICPEDKLHTVAANFSSGFNNSHLSYFAGLITNDMNPPAILVGDDNFTVSGKSVQSGLLNLETTSVVEWTAERHHYAGNVALADGSVQQTTSPSLNSLMQQTGVATNRLVIP